MTQGGILLRAVLGEPDDDLPRLAYADWLEESGTDPERAEFIQIQIERNRRATTGVRMSDDGTLWSAENEKGNRTILERRELGTAAPPASEAGLNSAQGATP